MAVVFLFLAIIAARPSNLPIKKFPFKISEDFFISSLCSGGDYPASRGFFCTAASNKSQETAEIRVQVRHK